ncbi:MAG TPA: DUF2085 domain-containing protein [Thermoplasmata archaeon]|nr:DUF2085 domain-containing protein [Thermoplasmata archaeon]
MPQKKSSWRTTLALLCLVGIILWCSAEFAISYLILSQDGFGAMPMMGKVSGNVTDWRTGIPIEGATVRIKDEGALTDSEGNFTIEIPWGNYEMSVSKKEYKTVKMEVWSTTAASAGEDAGLAITRERVKEKQLEHVKMEPGEGLIDKGEGNSIAYQGEFTSIRLKRLLPEAVFVVFAIPAAILVYRKENYCTAIIFTAASALTGTSTYLGMLLAGAALLLIVMSKDEFIDVRWAKQFNKSGLKSLLHILVIVIIIALAAMFTFRAAVTFIAPLALPPNSVPDLSGQPASIDNLEFTANLSQPWRWIYGSGDVSCHQGSDRSLHMNGNQMPLCSRCSGRELGMAIGMLLMVFKRFKINWRFVILIVLMVGSMAIDAVPQTLGLWESTNISRLITGFLFGAATSIIIGCVLRELADPTWGMSLRRRHHETVPKTF